MTLRDLVSTCHNIGQLSLDIRDERGILIDCVHIGTRCQPDKYANEEHNTAPRWKAINKPVNTKETGSDYWGTIISNIPKSLLDKEVTLWQFSMLYIEKIVDVIKSVIEKIKGVKK